MKKLEFELKGSLLDSLKFNGIEVLNTTKGWTKKSPILFPAIGKNKEFHVNDEVYKIPMHGFWNDIDFNIFKEDEGYILSAKVEHPVYPFDFEIEQYIFARKNKLSYVTNITGPEVPIQFGHHPAFMYDTGKMKYKGKAHCFMKDGSTKEIEVDFNNFNELDWENTDTFIFETQEMRLENNEYDVVVKTNMKYTAVWHAWDKFVCIEPWSDLPAAFGQDNNTLLDGFPFTMDIIIEGKD